MRVGLWFVGGQLSGRVCVLGVVTALARWWPAAWRGRAGLAAVGSVALGFRRFDWSTAVGARKLVSGCAIVSVRWQLCVLKAIVSQALLSLAGDDSATLLTAHA